jgi:hypothetical protein
MQWTVDSIKRRTTGYGDTIKTVGYAISATRHTEMGEHKIEIDVPLHMSHPLVGDVLNIDVSWQSLDTTIDAFDELEDARKEEANK